MIAPAQRLLLATAERAAATVRLLEDLELVEQMKAGVAAPVVAPLPLYVVVAGGELLSVHATPGEAEQYADPGTEIRPMTYRPGGGQS
ncbi:hypothetical protein ACIBCU_38175 [Streptomyces sp. NPDC051064]|uniref:hypothetical protein n=1 Tax=Streptomyces sp. NPDC051064 TaxID=3365641 RepID=UPI0037B1C1DB